MKHPDFIEKFLRRFFFRSLSAARQKEARAKHLQYKLPGFESLPLRIRGMRNKTAELIDATYKDVSEWVKRLRAQKRNDPRMKEAKALLEKMRVASRKRRGITVAEVFGLEKTK